ncbi:MAG TPA: 1-(5-phosphoribosyl)-5-[(5-phosphoribosylamino)methylideneamino]imidazole-4-carboxamide isomerase [Stellaceae bacterium]|nr:1-(5-phosphoribosyl)-5-[(5-phosphoribosylamino)methylideneamino]imidazole-4-carboxamide isomerase [Stellaceae bacterium]
MILFPAIDLKGGQCVRLLKGDMRAVTVFNDDPAAQAKSFAAAGFEWLHVVDLDGAVAGLSVNAPAVERILAAVALPIQLGGGIRGRRQVEEWLDRGVRRVILGTAALRDPELVKSACRAHPDRIVVGIDARHGKVAVEGWAKTSEMTAVELSLRFEDAGVAAIVFTDIERDGALAGVNVEATAALARRLETPVIASGGLASLDDIRALRRHERDGIAGVICGRALYDGRIEPKAALALAAERVSC